MIKTGDRPPFPRHFLGKWWSVPGLLLLACGLAFADEPSMDEMIEALATKPTALSRGIGKTPAKREGKLQLQIQFEYNSDRISPESRELLLKLANAMKSPALDGNRFRVEGHTDASGSVSGNIRLSQRRALAVTEFLKANSGVDANHMTPWGLGSSTLANARDPLAAENRRVVIISMEPLPSGTASNVTSGSVVQLNGTLTARRKDQEVPLLAGARVQEGDVLVTAERTSALVRMDDGANLLMRAETQLKIAKLKLQGDNGAFRQVYELLAGACRYVTGALGKSQPTAIAFNTGTATVGIRGTDFDLVYTTESRGEQEAGTYVRVSSGAVSLGGLDGSSVQIAKDEQAYAGKPKPVTRGGAKMPAATRIKDADTAGIFKTDDLDALLEPR
jgi:OmpA-OmpF porin, OOP family